MTPERLIEVTIGLFDEPCPPGEYPPRLAAAITRALRENDWSIVAIPPSLLDALRGSSPGDAA